MFDFSKMSEAFAALETLDQRMTEIRDEQRTTNVLLGMLIAERNGGLGNQSWPRDTLAFIEWVGPAALEILGSARDIATGPHSRT